MARHGRYFVDWIFDAIDLETKDHTIVYCNGRTMTSHMPLRSGFVYLLMLLLARASSHVSTA
jgi:hypothetical protein